VFDNTWFLFKNILLLYFIIILLLYYYYYYYFIIFYLKIEYHEPHMHTNANIKIIIKLIFLSLIYNTLLI